MLRSDGAGYGLIQLPRGGSRLPYDGGADGLAMQMPDGRAVFAHAVDGMTTASQQAAIIIATLVAGVLFILPSVLVSLMRQCRIVKRSPRK